MKGRKSFKIQHWMIISTILIIYDALAVSAAYYFALLARFDFRYSVIPPLYLGSYLKFLPVYIVICIILFWNLGLYKSLWRFASFYELSRIALSSVVSTVAQIIGTTIIIQRMYVSVGRMPVSYYVVAWIPETHNYGILYLLISGVASKGVTPRSR